MFRTVRRLVSVSALMASLVDVRAELQLKPDDLVAVCGDSITEQKEYTVLIADYLLMCRPTAGLRVIQLGWSGEKSTGFVQRLDTDLYPFKPQVVTTCFGMNDGGYSVFSDQMGAEYRNAQTQIVASLKKHGVRTIVIGSPGCVDSFSYVHKNPDVYNETLRQLARVAREVAEREHVLYADVNGTMTETMVKAKAALGPEYAVAGADGIHPDANGHLVMAYAFLKALGCDGDIATISVDFDSIRGIVRAGASEGQKVVSVKGNSLDLESSRYPFCFFGNPKDPKSTAGITDFFPFNQDLNRYRLVVRGLRGTKAKVTWGSATKLFSTMELQKGVNLAAEFLSNPFSSSFAKVDASLRAQQDTQTLLIKTLLHNKSAFKAMALGQEDSVDRIAQAGIERDAALFKTAASLVVPVRHTITIEQMP